MANFQRFQTISTGPQNLFDPDCPVWVSRCRLSRDLETGKRLLQVRMVNCSDKKITRVFLRVKCADGAGQGLTVLQMVPTPSLLAMPGRAFGDDKIIELPAPETTFVEAFAQRVEFSDQTSWNERSAHHYLAFPAPVQVSAADPDYPKLRELAERGGVRNSYRFHSQKDMWLCTCGQPNGSAVLRCAHCGADRLWLEKHMDPDYREPAPVQPAAPVPAPVPAPAPVVVPILPAQPAPAPRTSAYGAVPPQSVPARPREDDEPERSHAGRTLAIILAILLFLSVGGWVAFRELRPYLRYREAEKAVSAGNYEQAELIFKELGDYKNSAARVGEMELNKIRVLMKDGDYEQALQLLDGVRSLEGAGDLRADCYYSLAVLAFNDGDLERTASYTEQLAAEYPDYPELPKLQQYLHYSLGNQAFGEAAKLADNDPAKIPCFEKAIQEYSQTDYKDSADRLRESRYRIAIVNMNLGRYQDAIQQFTNLGDYLDSQRYRADCMFAYAKTHLEMTDSLTLDYLTELAGEGYDGAQELLDRLNGVGFVFSLTADPTVDPRQPLTVASDLSKVYLAYHITPREGAGAVIVLVVYQLPDGRQGRGVLNSDGSAVGAKRWSDLFPAECSVGGTVTVSFYDSAVGEGIPLETLSFDYQPASEPEDASGQSPETGGEE